MDVCFMQHIFGMKEREASSYERYGPLVSNPAKV